MKHTKGEWEINYREDDNFGKPIKLPETIRTKQFGVSDLMADYRGNIICSFNESHGNRPHAYKEAEANAKLIAEAGTVTNETGYTPSQLAEQKTELLEELTLLLKYVEDVGNEQGIWCENEQIRDCKRAIEKATS